MQVQVTGKHTAITPALRSFVTDKMAKLEDVYPRLKKVAVILTVEKYRHTAEIHFRAEGAEMSAKKTTKDMYASIEECLSALEQQASKRKDRLHTQGAHRRAGQRVSKLAGKRTAKSGKAALDEAAAPKRSKSAVSRLKNPASKPMSLEDAQSMLAESADGFVLFRDAEHGKATLLFTRADGTTGIMEA